MGVSISITIGPYIEVKGKKEKTEVKIKRICPNHPNQKQGDSKFCSTCGTEVQNVEYTETKVLSPARIFYGTELVDSLYSPEGMENLFLPCAKVPNKIRMDEYGGSVDLSSCEEIKSEQVKWMEEKYQEEIDFLSDNFGVENVSVRWGIVSYWS